MFYSAEKNGFYAREIHGDDMPADVVEITAEEHAALLAGQSNGKTIAADEAGRPVLQDPPPPTTEQLREEWKASRDAAVEAIDVTTDAGNTFDGDEVSQGRMARAILALNAAAPGTTVNWILADNSVIDATAAELTEALALAGAAQAALWVLP